MTNEEIDDFLKWNVAIKDYDEFYHAMLRSTRAEMARWMQDINAQFITQIAFTVDRLNRVASLNETLSCVEKFRGDAGTEIQEIVRKTVDDFEFYQRDYVYLLADVTDQYVSFNQKWPKRVWSEHNMVTRFDIITYLMETYIYFFYKTLFDAQVEELLIDMGYFRDLIDETRQRTFVALNSVGERMERNLMTC